MEAIILCGIQASGKTTFCRERFFETHIRINLDMLRTRHRERLLVEACLAAKQPFVVDNTNPTRADRARYIAAAKAAGFQIVGYYFQSRIEDCMRRNEARTSAQVIPARGITAAHRRLEVPSMDEGFEALYYVRIDEGGAFMVEVCTGSLAGLLEREARDAGP